MHKNTFLISQYILFYTLLCSTSLKSEAKQAEFKSYGMVAIGYRKDIIKNSRGEYLVKYLDEQERKKYKVKFKRGYFYGKECGVYKPQSGEFIFVMDEWGKFYIGKKIDKRFHHSSFLAGAPAASAGILTLEEGRLTSISAYSGHYMTSKIMFKQALAKLHSEQVPNIKDVMQKKTLADRLNNVVRSWVRFFQLRYSCEREDFPCRPD
ncbi:MAG: hypothetical protein HRU09_20190 [Oligoflexales bacterium]|nr:hypothetical protein [Oligoflexales bacterium]